MSDLIKASAFALAVSVGTSAFGVQRTQNFDTNPPDWLVDNTITPQGGTVPDPPAAGNDFGFSNTNKAGGQPGEAGGRVTRLRNDLDTTDANSTLRGASYSTDVGTIDAKTDTLTMSGLYANPGNEPNEYVGYFDPAGIFPFRPDDQIGFRVDQFVMRVNVSGGGQNFLDEPVGGGPEPADGNYPESFTLTYTPTETGATISGTVTDLVASAPQDLVQAGVIPFEFTITAEQRDAIKPLTRFGIFTLDNNQGNEGLSYYDNFSYTSNAAGGVEGDFNADQVVDATDIDLLCDRVNGTGDVEPFDLNNDGSVNMADVTFQVTNILETKFGDTDTDGDVDLNDLGNLASGFGQPGEKRWSRGNFDCDQDVDLPDLGTLATNFDTGRAAALAAFESLVPEPSALSLLALGALSLRRRSSRV